MSAVAGVWKIELPTPMGTQRFTLDVRDDGTAVSGTATNNNGTYPMHDVAASGADLAFAIDVTAPFPLTVRFALTVDGNAIAGESQAAAFPAVQVAGRRE